MAASALLLVVFLAADGGLEPPEVTALAPGHGGAAALDLDAGYPVDPFSAEYLPPLAQEVGPAKGQVRVFGLAGVTSGPDVLGTLTVESLHLAFLALRGSVAVELSHFDAARAHLVSARFGVALHVAPYRRLDASIFVDAGLALVDLFSPQRSAAPLLSPGVALEVAFTAHLFLRAEGQLSWLRAPETVLRWAGLLGLGWAL